MKQLEAISALSAQCEQYIRYDCKNGEDMTPRTTLDICMFLVQLH